MFCKRFLWDLVSFDYCKMSQAPVPAVVSWSVLVLANVSFYKQYMPLMTTDDCQSLSVVMHRMTKVYRNVVMEIIVEL